MTGAADGVSEGGWGLEGVGASVDSLGLPGFFGLFGDLPGFVGCAGAGGFAVGFFGGSTGLAAASVISGLPTAVKAPYAGPRLFE